MSALGNIDSKLPPLEAVLTQADTFPYDLTNRRINGISIANDSTTDELIVNIQDEKSKTISIPVGVGKTFGSLTKTLISIAVAGASVDFKISLFSGGLT